MARHLDCRYPDDFDALEAATSDGLTPVIKAAQMGQVARQDRPRHDRRRVGVVVGVGVVKNVIIVVTAVVVSRARAAFFWYRPAGALVELLVVVVRVSPAVTRRGAPARVFARDSSLRSSFSRTSAPTSTHSTARVAPRSTGRRRATASRSSTSSRRTAASAAP